MREMTIELTGTPAAQKQVAQGLTLEEARDLLDWLEANEIGQPEIAFEESGRILVTWSA